MTETEVLCRHRGLFRDYWDAEMTEMHTTMYWGLEVRDDWLPALDRMCFELESIEEEAVDNFRIILDQVKEKFRSLRVYFHLEDQEGANVGFRHLRTLDILIRECISKASVECDRIEKERKEG